MIFSMIFVILITYYCRTLIFHPCFWCCFLGAQHPTAMLRRMGLPVPEELERRLVAWQRYLQKKTVMDYWWVGGLVGCWVGGLVG